ncbi:MAG: OmpA family protein [Spirochaetales bacterium]
MRKALVILLSLPLVGLALPAQEVTFEFQYGEGDQYRIVSTVAQDVWVNGLYSHSATILNRITVEVTDVEDGRGYHVATFVTSEESRGGTQVYTWGEEYPSEFWRDEQGYYQIGREYYMPVVRDVPVFPDEPLEPGDGWSADGHEVHDFRRQFGIPEPYRFPIPADYRFREIIEEGGREYALIEISYEVDFRPDRAYANAVYPTSIQGFSNQLLYWNIDEGRPDRYEEEYGFLFGFSSGDQVVYEGTAEAEVVQAERMDRDEVADQVRRDLDEFGFEDQEVVQDERGVTIRLDNILFPPDSPSLRESEKAKLRQIARILERYPDRDIFIGGHTALAGTEEGRQELSRQRAAAVADYLLELGIRDANEMVLRGYGATQPVATNQNEEGRRKNRRVEITILEN